MAQKTNVYQCIKQENTLNKTHIAIIYKNKMISYEELFRDVENLAERLNAYSISEGSRVALHCPDSIEYITISLALLAQGAVLIPVNWAMPETEINELCTGIAAEFIISRCSNNLNGHFTCNDSAFTVKRLVPLKSAPGGIAEMNPAFIRFTSGTTGNSKGVIISHQGVLERTAAADRGLQVKSGDTILWTLSMSYHFVVTILLFLARRNYCNMPGTSAAFDGFMPSGAPDNFSLCHPISLPDNDRIPVIHSGIDESGQNRRFDRNAVG